MRSLSPRSIIGKHPKKTINIGPSSPSGPTLPTAGPFSGQSAPLISSLSDATISADTTLNSSRTSQYQKKTLTINSGINLSPDLTQTGALFIWADKLVLNGTIHANGSNGAAGSSSGALGGSGGSGGGGGSGLDDIQDIGGAGGSGGDGGSVPTAPSGQGGKGWGTSYNSSFTYGNGANGVASSGSFTLIAAGGSGGNGFGGGGGGGSNSQVGNGNGGSGGGGGGLLAIVVNWLTGSSGVFKALGGSGGTGTPGIGGAGGKGVGYIAAKKYDGSIATPLANFNTLSLYEITSSNTLILHTNWADSWDNT